MKSKKIRSQNIGVLCAGAFLATMVNCLSVHGEGGLAFSEFKEIPSNHTYFETLVKAFEESANKEIILNWKNDPSPTSTKQTATLLDTNKPLLYSIFTVIKNYSDGTNLFHEETDKKGRVELVREQRGSLFNDSGTPPQVRIYMGGNAYKEPWKGPSYLEANIDRNSILTKEKDQNGSQWEIRQYNKDIILFAQRPNEKGECFYQYYEEISKPVDGYCLIGYMENEK